MNVFVFVEGGGDRNKDLQTQCKKGFRQFLRKAGFQDAKLKIVPSGDRGNAIKDFAKHSQPSDTPAVLLVDSEGPAPPLNNPQSLWSWLGYTGPQSGPISDENVHLMVQMMESWFLADQPALAEFYGQGFHAGSLPQNPRIERIPKQDVEQGLENATRSMGKRKFRHAVSFQILERIDPGKVRQASPYADRFLTRLDQLLT